MDKEGVEDVADILEEQRPCRPVEREHLAVAAHLVRTARPCRNHEHGAQQGQHGHRHRYAAAIPALAALKEEADQSYHGGKHHERMQPDNAAAEEVAHREAALPTVVVGIADNETRQQEEEVDGQVAVVEVGERAVAHTAHRAGKGVALEDMGDHDKQGGHAAQAVEQFIVRLGVGKTKGRSRGAGECFGHVVKIWSCKNTKRQAESQHRNVSIRTSPRGGFVFPAEMAHDFRKRAVLWRRKPLGSPAKGRMSRGKGKFSETSARRCMVRLLPTAWRTKNRCIKKKRRIVRLYFFSYLSFCGVG